MINLGIIFVAGPKTLITIIAEYCLHWNVTGCDLVIATHSVGSLIEEYKPGDFILIDQIIDRTTKRHLTYYDNQETSWHGVCHSSFGDPYDTKLRKVYPHLLITICFTALSEIIN